MKKLFFLFILTTTIFPCSETPVSETKKEDNKELDSLFANYYEERLALFPLEATTVGDNRYNNIMYIPFTDSYRANVKDFFQRNLDLVSTFNRDSLSDNDRISYDIFKREMEMSIEGLSFHDNYIPCHQFWGLPITLGLLGSGNGDQPFKTVKDYDDWLARAKVFSAWTDSAIVYFRKGIETNFVLPKLLVEKMLPQMNNIQSEDATKSIFYGPR